MRGRRRSWTFYTALFGLLLLLDGALYLLLRGLAAVLVLLGVTLLVLALIAWKALRRQPPDDDTR